MKYSLEQDPLTGASESDSYGRGSQMRTALFWLACAGITWAIYWICLRFLFPAYFAPLSPFHVDFYVYAAVREQSFRDLILTFPRPVTFLALKILASAGLTNLMRGGVAIALIDVLLTLALVRRMLRLYTPWLLASYAVYAFLLFAHPQFYVEHRHDLPAELSWFFLTISLLTWMSWVEYQKAGTAARIGKTGQFAMLAAAAISAILFAFAKETYFISALILVLGMAIADRTEWRRHLAFMALLVVVEFASFAWTGHFNGPFVNLNADSNAAYHISLAPGSVLQTYWFYLSALLNPFLIAIAGLGIIAARYRRGRFILTIAWVLAGVAVFATLAVLPNHKFEEYAWAGAPLFLAPILALCNPAFYLRWKAAQIALIGIVLGLVVAGPAGYYRQYRTDAARWWVAQDQRSAAVWSSLDRFQTIPRPARILVTGIDDPMLPWQVQDFVQRQFGDGIQWTVALPPDIQYRRGGRLVKFVNPAAIRLSDFDYLTTYRSNGHLADIRAVKDISASPELAETMLPDLADLMAAARREPQNYRLVLKCAEVCVNWGFWREAGQFLDKAEPADGCDPTFQRLSSDVRNRLREGLASQTRVPRGKVQLAAKPATGVRPDRTGLGVVELSWSAPEGVGTEIHVGAPNGALFTAGGGSGHAVTEKWVKDGMQFFLQDVTGGKALTSENTLAVVKVDASLTGVSEVVRPATGAAANGVEFTGYPAHIVQPDRSGLGSTELIWKAPAAAAVEIRVCSPRGMLFASGGSSGRAATQKWVTNGMQFFLQDVTGGKPLTSENTLAVTQVEVTQ